MSEHSQIYQYSRVAGTIGAGIFTGLALSAPFYTVPATSVFAIVKSFRAKSYETDEDKLSAKDRLTLFKAAHQTTGAIAIPVAVISALLFGVAGYTIPLAGAYNSRYLGRGAGEIGTRYISDSLLTRLTAPRALLVGAAVSLLAVIPISSLISENAARGAMSLSTQLAGEKKMGSGANAGIETEAEKQLDKQLVKWTFGAQLASLVGLLATLAGALQLSGHSVVE